MLHPSFVYAAKIYPDTQNMDDRFLIVASACFDQKIRLWQVLTSATEEDQAKRLHQWLTPLQVFSILDPPTVNFGVKQTMYDADQLDDDALETIMNPITANKREIEQEPLLQANSEKKTVKGTIFDQAYPNCLCFSDSGRLFIGDSRGTITGCDIGLRYGGVEIERLFKIQHKELMGDQINQIIMHPDTEKQLFVQSRDNCVRLIQYEAA